ncbi:ComEC/Rec2 family competence protein [Cytobacillus sp. Hz8]|uniref:ComEC/Rec2 family competence protein n=1 Tax=Cytobacillus sp. Hz8 TaxID=3347168 RepID=UPI0035DB8649
MEMTINFYDVEHGSCTHIITLNNKHILVDIGSKTYKSITSYIRNKYLRYYGGNIDELIITHPHEDHIYDLPQLYNILKPRVLQRPKGAFDIIPTQNTALHKEIADYANKMNREYSNPIGTGENPLYSSNNGGVDIEIISSADSWTTKDDLNTFSSIIIINYEGYKFILTGDNPKSILQNMIEINYCDIKNKISNATALLAPHHGRTGEYCDSFFKLVNPYLTIVSDKSIVHTTQEKTAQLYKGRGAKLYGKERYVLTTRNDGTISFTVTTNSCTVSMNQEGY